MLVCGAGPGCNNAGVARAICQVRHGGLEPLVLALGEGRREGTCPTEASPSRSTSVALKYHGKNVGCCYFSDNTADDDDGDDDEDMRRNKRSLTLKQRRIKQPRVKIPLVLWTVNQVWETFKDQFIELLNSWTCRNVFNLILWLYSSICCHLVLKWKALFCIDAAAQVGED